MRIFAGLYKNRSLKAPKGASTRPTTGIVRQAVFNIIQNHVEGIAFLDLFSGSGAMGLEALSRGAKYSVLVEKDRTAVKCINENVEHLGVTGKVKIVNLDVIRALINFGTSKAQFDCIYADPPYMQESEEEGLVSEHVVSLIGENSLLKKGGILFVEEDRAAKLDEKSFKGLELIEKRNFGKSFLYIFRPKTLSK